LPCVPPPTLPERERGAAAQTPTAAIRRLKVLVFGRWRPLPLGVGGGGTRGGGLGRGGGGGGEGSVASSGSPARPPGRGQAPPLLWVRAYLCPARERGRG